MSASQFAPIVLLHPEETNFPMQPLEFISISRFRHHIAWGRDFGYNKVAQDWIRTNERSPEYYDIPLDVINSFGLHPNGDNRRPRDRNRGRTWNVFLDADGSLGSLEGSRNPNNVVPVYFYQQVQDDGRIYHQYWFFFGYNPSIALRHQGDWEDFTAVTLDNQLTGAYFSAHGDRRYVPREELELEGERVKVYCARGSHALYPRAGTFNIFGTDQTAPGGYQWNTSLKIELLSDQPWRDYAGAWGEVGEFAASTGPLGPWHKPWRSGEVT